MSPGETPPRRRGRADAASSRIGIGLVVVLALLGLVVVVTQSSAGSTPTTLARSVPMRVTIPALSVTSSLVALGQKPDGSLQVPPLSTPMQASWWDGSPTPGEIGPAVVLGHVDGNGKPGVFYTLDKVQVGQEVLVDRQDGQTAVFQVSRVDTVPKDAFPTDAVYGDTPASEIRLITCGGELDRRAHNYLSNVIVFGDLVGVRRT